MKRTFAAAMASALLLALPAHGEDKPAEKEKDNKDYVILKVDGDPVKKSEVEATWKSIFGNGAAPAFDGFDPKVKENVLRGVASERILEKEALKTNVQDNPDVEGRIAAAKRQIVIQQFLKEKTKDLVTDEKLKAIYDQKVKEAESKGSTADELHARHILVKTKPEAEDIEKKIKKGGDFEKLAKEKSQDKGSGAIGGDLGWFTADKMVPEFSKAVLALKPGEISQPVKTDFGWHVIKLEERRKAALPAFEALKDSLRQEAGNDAVKQYVEGLMKNVKLTTLDAEGHEKDLVSIPPEKESPAAGKTEPAEK